MTTSPILCLFYIFANYLSMLCHPCGLRNLHHPFNTHRWLICHSYCVMIETAVHSPCMPYYTRVGVWMLLIFNSSVTASFITFSCNEWVSMSRDLPSTMMRKILDMGTCTCVVQSNDLSLLLFVESTKRFSTLT